MASEAPLHRNGDAGSEAKQGFGVRLAEKTLTLFANSKTNVSSCCPMKMGALKTWKSLIWETEGREKWARGES